MRATGALLGNHSKPQGSNHERAGGKHCLVHQLGQAQRGAPSRCCLLCYCTAPSQAGSSAVALDRTRVWLRLASRGLASLLRQLVPPLFPSAPPPSSLPFRTPSLRARERRVPRCKPFSTFIPTICQRAGRRERCHPRPRRRRRLITLPAHAAFGGCFTTPPNPPPPTPHGAACG